jgi:hypothetical protein
MGGLPQVFNGDRARADDFIEEVKGYLRLNQDVAGYNSPIKKVAFTLTLIKGPEVAGWTRDIGAWIDTMDPVADNLPEVWDTFLVEFATQFQDSSRGERARIDLESCRMRYPFIDEYISKFEGLARIAGYTQGSPESTHYFLKGLTRQILEDVMRGDAPTTYAAIKQKAISCTRSQQLLASLLNRRTPGGGFQGGAFGQFQRQQQQRQPFFRPNNFYNQRGGQPSNAPRPQYNSSNAPRSYNNIPVPIAIDLDRTRAPTWRGRGRGRGFARGQAAQTSQSRYTPPGTGQTNLAHIVCYHCGETGHYARNCPMKTSTRGMTADLIDFNPLDYQQPAEEDRVARLKAELGQMSNDEKERLARELGGTLEEDLSQDFLNV